MPGASITVHRPLEWIDTDAAGIWHYTTAIRYAEHAELELHRALGIMDQTFGRTPRVHIELDLISPVRFGDWLATTLTVADVGRSSISYDVTITSDRDAHVRGRIVTVLLDRPGGRSVEVPDDLRAALTDGSGLTGQSLRLGTEDGRHEPADAEMQGQPTNQG